MLTLPIYQVDAFTNKTFGGNPAAVVPLQEWLPDEVMQKIAIENNLSETAFFVPTEKGYHLRWFTPEVEVDLCGHATLATSWVIFHELNHQNDEIIFDSRSGELVITKSENGFTMNFPLWDDKQVELDERVAKALGHDPIELYHGHDWVAVYNDEKIVETMQPDMQKLSEISECRGILATAASKKDVDFVSRFFAPNVGVPEDPVTGSAHCILGPIWQRKLQKNELKARQVSARSGDLGLLIKDDRIYITGEAALYLKGEIYV
ncbi:MAG: PhzF family phenazine biosynthesis protein [Pseudomonadota bacterium]